MNFFMERQMYVAIIVNICNIDMIFIVITDILKVHRTLQISWKFSDLGHI